MAKSSKQWNIFKSASSFALSCILLFPEMQFVLVDHLSTILISHLLIISIKNKNQSARKKTQKRIEKFTHKARNLHIAIGADTCKKAPFLIEKKYIYINTFSLCTSDYSCDCSHICQMYRKHSDKLPHNKPLWTMAGNRIRSFAPATITKYACGSSIKYRCLPCDGVDNDIS